MPEVVVDIAAGWATLLLFGGGLLLLRAPDTLHRVLALDVLVAIVIILLTILSYLRDVSYYIDAALALALLALDVDARRRPLRHPRRAVLMILDVVGAVLLLLGLLLATIGLYGLLRMPDIFHQLHPAGLVTGPAVILVLLASVATGSAEIITSALSRDPVRADHVAAVDPRDRAGRAPSPPESARGASSPGRGDSTP